MRKLALLSLGLVALCYSQGTPLKKVMKVDNVAKYKLRMELAMFGDTAVYTATVTETITQVSPEGDYKVSLTQSDYKALIFGDEASIMESDLPKISYTFDNCGELKLVEGDLVNESVYRVAALWSFPLPNKEVAPGETWTYDRKGDATKGLVDSQIKYKVEPAENFGEKPCTVLSYEMKELKGTEPAQSVGKLWIDQADGSIAKMEMKWTAAPIPGSPGPTSGTVTYERVSP